MIASTNSYNRWVITIRDNDRILGLLRLEQLEDEHERQRRIAEHNLLAEQLARREQQILRAHNPLPYIINSSLVAGAVLGAIGLLLAAATGGLSLGLVVVGLGLGGYSGALRANDALARNIQVGAREVLCEARIRHWQHESQPQYEELLERLIAALAPHQHVAARGLDAGALHDVQEEGEHLQDSGCKIEANAGVHATPHGDRQQSMTK